MHLNTRIYAENQQIYAIVLKIMHCKPYPSKKPQFFDKNKLTVRGMGCIIFTLKKA